MRNYKHILLWENLFRIQRLASFQKLVHQYFQSAKYDWVVDGRIEDANAKQLRSKINQSINIIASIVESSGVSAIINWSPPPDIGDYTRNIHLIKNIFRLGDFRIGYDTVIDNLDQAIGVYKSNTIWSAIRIINPFFYLNLIFVCISNLPFLAIGKMGFNRNRAESSLLGRLTKALIYMLSAFASLLTIIEVFGGLDKILNWFKIMISSFITI